MRKLRLGMFVLGWLFYLVTGVPAREVDILVNKLVEKGILTTQEAQEILAETKQEAVSKISEEKSSVLPSWIENTKLKGDMRIRHQYEKRHGQASRNRARLRYRLGIESEVTDHVKVGAGLASGGSDPRSSNVTFENTFDTPDIRLNLAFVEYASDSWGKAVAGKFKRDDYLWAPTDLLWDGDINPEGASVHGQHSLVGDIKSFINFGGWVLDESSLNQDDPFMYYGQPGLIWDGKGFDAQASFNYYGFSGIQGVRLDHCAGTNTGLSLVGGSCSGGSLSYDYDSLGGSAEFGISEPLGLPIKRIATFGEYHVSHDANEENTAWVAGVKFGHKKVKQRGEWQIRYQYAHLEKDAFPDVFPDSDRYGGETDTQGHEAIVEFGLWDHVTLSVDYYHDKKIKAEELPQTLIQGDLNMMF